MFNKRKLCLWFSMFACLFLQSWCAKERGVDSFVSLCGTNQELVLLALDPYQCEWAELTISGLAVTKQISPLFSNSGAEVMLSPFALCAGHLRSHRVFVCRYHRVPWAPTIPAMSLPW